MFDFDDKMLCGHGGHFPPEKPRYTMQEELNATAKNMRETIDRLLKFEERAKQEIEDRLRAITSDNVIFKDTLRETWVTFLNEVKNEINLFEGNVDNTVALFKADIESGYKNLSEDTKTTIATKFKELSERLANFETGVTTGYEEFKTLVESRIELHNDNITQAFNTYKTSMDTLRNAFETQVNETVSSFIEETSTANAEYKENLTQFVENKVYEQDGKIEEAVTYMKSNLNANISTLLNDMIANGTADGIVESDLIVNAKYFGAVGDGVTDDTVALQTGLSYAIYHNKAFYIPSGTYSVKTLRLDVNSGINWNGGLGLSAECYNERYCVPSYNDIIIYGDGDTTIIKGMIKDSRYGEYEPWYHNGSEAFVYNISHKIILKNFVMDGDNKHKNAITLYGLFNYLDNVTIKNYTGIGLSLYGDSQDYSVTNSFTLEDNTRLSGENLNKYLYRNNQLTTVKDCQISYNGLGGIDITNHLDYTIDNCSIFSNGFLSEDTTASGSQLYLRTGCCKMSNTHIFSHYGVQANRYGMSINTQASVLATNCHFEGARTVVGMWGGDNKFVNCYFYNTTGANTIYMDDRSGNNAFTNCIIKGASSDTEDSFVSCFNHITNYNTFENCSVYARFLPEHYNYENRETFYIGEFNKFDLLMFTEDYPYLDKAKCDYHLRGYGGVKKYTKPNTDNDEWQICNILSGDTYIRNKNVLATGNGSTYALDFDYEEISKMSVGDVYTIINNGDGVLTLRASDPIMINGEFVNVSIPAHAICKLYLNSEYNFICNY